eukprot:403374263
MRNSNQVQNQPSANMKQAQNQQQPINMQKQFSPHTPQETNYNQRQQAHKPSSNQYQRSPPQQAPQLQNQRFSGQIQSNHKEQQIPRNFDKQFANDYQQNDSQTPSTRNNNPKRQPFSSNPNSSNLSTYEQSHEDLLPHKSLGSSYQNLDSRHQIRFSAMQQSSNPSQKLGPSPSTFQPQRQANSTMNNNLKQNVNPSNLQQNQQSTFNRQSKQVNVQGNQSSNIRSKSQQSYIQPRFQSDQQRAQKIVNNQQIENGIDNFQARKAVKSQNQVVNKISQAKSTPPPVKRSNPHRNVFQKISDHQSKLHDFYQTSTKIIHDIFSIGDVTQLIQLLKNRHDDLANSIQTDKVEALSLLDKSIQLTQESLEQASQENMLFQERKNKLKIETQKITRIYQSQAAQLDFLSQIN